MRALQRFDLEARVSEAFDEISPRTDSSLRVIAIGKAARAMARGLTRSRQSHVREGLLIEPTGWPAARLKGRWTELTAAHPIPNTASVGAGLACLEFVARGANDPLVVLVSGGASSLVCAPHERTSLREKQRVTRALLSRGASITEINTVRKHLSLIKGGGLLAASVAPSVHTVAVSDVIGGTLSDIASGPSAPDTSTVSDARRIARRYSLDPLLSQSFLPTPALSSRVHRVRTRAAIAASPETFAAYVATALRSLGTVRTQRPLLGDIRDVANAVASLARRLRVGEILVYPSEPTVVLPQRAGKGGRSCHLAALVAESLPEGVCFAALGTDGADGTSGTAGAVVDATLASHPLYRSSLARFDTVRLHRAAGSAIETGPTGLNFADIHVLMRV